MAQDPLDKVRKLLALSKSSNVHEAALAAAQAQALIERYRLEELLQAQEPAESELIEEEILESARRQRRWKTVLAVGLAEANACLSFTRESVRERQIVLAGRAADRASVRSLWDWLVPQLEWLSATHGQGHDKRWHDDFRVGAASTVCARLNAVNTDQKAQFEANALVRLEPALVARQTALADYAHSRLELRSGRRVMVDVDAWKAGRKAATTVALGGPDEI